MNDNTNIKTNGVFFGTILMETVLRIYSMVRDFHNFHLETLSMVIRTIRKEGLRCSIHNLENFISPPS